MATSSNSTSDQTKARRQKRTKMEPSKANKESNATSTELGNTLRITETSGDIFDAPPNTLIIHACNCYGSWGAGIAKAFKDRYPYAYKAYTSHCGAYSPDQLIETAQLIPPPSLEKNEDGGKDETHFVGCLFTSHHFGRRKDSPYKILAATKPAMEDLLRQVQDWNASHDKDGEKVKEVRMCKINSGMFAVPWEKSRQVLEGIEVGEEDVKEVKVVSPPG